jgi:putative transposase
MVSPQARREAVTVLMTERDFGVTRACGLLQISRALYRYQSRRPECASLRERIAEIAALKASVWVSTHPCAAASRRLAGEP